MLWEVKRRWRIFYRFWCGGLSYWLLGEFYSEIGNHRWKYGKDYVKRTCSRCGRHEWVMTRKYRSIGQAESHWVQMNHDEHRWV